MQVQRPKLTAHRYVIDCTAMACAMLVIYSIVELLILRLPWQVSMRVRLLMVAFVFAGLGIAIASVRDWSIAKTGRMHRNSAWGITVHDLIFVLTANLLLSPFFYWVSGANLTEIVLGTAGTLGVSTISGPINGLAIDRFRSWAGLEARRFKVAQPPKLHLVLLSTMLVIALVGLLFWAVSRAG